MGKMKQYAEDLAEKYLQKHPEKSWEEAMELVCSKYNLKGEEENGISE